MASDRLSLVLAAGQRHLAAGSLKRMNKEVSDLLKDPLDHVFFLQEPWDEAPSDFHPERWVFHVRGHYDLYVRFPVDYPFRAPYVDVQILGAHMPVKQYLHYATSLESDRSKPKPGYEDAFARVNTPTSAPLCFDHTRWSPALTVRRLVTQLIDDPALQEALARAGTFYT